MLIDYIKDIVDSDGWDIEIKEGKYIVKRILDCKDNYLTYSLGKTASHWMVESMRVQLRIYLPEDMYEVKYEFINTPKPKIQLYGGIDMAKKADTYINVYRLYENNIRAHITETIIERPEL
jgi:hypothetical protein